MQLDTEAVRIALASFIAGQTGATGAGIVGYRKLTGGAIQENWFVDLELEGGSMPGRHAVVVRTDAPSGIEESHPRAAEFRIIEAASRAGVCVPEPLWLHEGGAGFEHAFYVSRYAEGTAAGHRIVREAALGGDREALAERLGAELARIHRIGPATHPELGFLPRPEPDPASWLIARYRHYLDRLPDAHPVLEWGLRWAERHVPEAPEDLVLAHRDFRTGNYMVDGDGLTGILDWEFSGWGDPMEDVAWLCCRCWRFGAWELEAGGIAQREPFYRAYEAASGRRIDAGRVRFWEVMGHLRWAVLALHQAERHASGEERSLLLALTGRIAAECELEVLLLTKDTA